MHARFPWELVSGEHVGADRPGLLGPPPGPLQRVLLSADGNVGRILESYAGESVEAVKLEQFSAPFGEDPRARTGARRRALLSTSEPIGRLLAAARAETFREVLTSGTTPAGAVGGHFGVEETDEVFVRTYRIVAGGRPMMLITEKFPTTWFLS